MPDNEEEHDTRHVIIDAEKQVLECRHCGGTWPLDDGVNGKPIWYATAIMRGFTNEHAECEKPQEESDAA